MTGAASRSLIAPIAIALIIVPSIACIALNAEYWPYSQYPMYAEEAEVGPSDAIVLMGQTAGEPSEETMIMHEKYIRPFDWTRLAMYFRRLDEQPDAPTRRQAALNDIARRYEHDRQAGMHRGPQLTAVKVYRYEWDMTSPDNPPDYDHPSSRHLLGAAAIDSGAPGS
jgi:hypothetical protein